MWLVLVFAACPIVVPPAARQYNDECVRLYVLKDYAQAEAACDLALGYQELYWDALHNKGLIRLAVNDRSTAKSLFIKALRANQDMAQSYNMLALMALEDRDFKAARELAGNAVRLQPEFLAGRNTLGLACLALNDLDGAEKAYRQLILSSPNASEGYAMLGEISLRRQKPADAIEWLLKAVQLEANYGDAWRALGVAYVAVGRRDEAKDAFENCLDARPNDLVCRDALKQLVE